MGRFCHIGIALNMFLELEYKNEQTYQNVTFNLRMKFSTVQV